jgi:hypothetical protein
MSIELRKYIGTASKHPLAPFTIVVRGESTAALVSKLELVLQDMGIKLPKPSEAKAEAKPEVKIIRNPKHCANVRTMNLTKGKTHFYVQCEDSPDGMLVPAGLIYNDVDFKDCYECKKFKPTQSK